MGDVTNYASGVLLPLLDTVARVLTAVLLLATLFLVQPVIAVSAAVILGGFYAVTFRLLTRKRREVDENLKIHVAGSYREAHQMLGGIKPVKVHRAEEHFLARFASHSAIMARMFARMPIFANSARYFVEPLAFGGLVVAVLFWQPEDAIFPISFRTSVSWRLQVIGCCPRSSCFTPTHSGQLHASRG